MDDPIIKINFLDGQNKSHEELKNGYNKSNLEYKQAVEDIEKWQGMFDVIIHNKTKD